KLAPGVRLAYFLVVDSDRGVRDGRPLLRDGKGDEARGLQIGVERVLFDGAVLGQLDQKGGLPRLDVVAGQFLDDEHLDLGPWLPLDALGEDPCAVGDALLLAEIGRASCRERG